MTITRVNVETLVRDIRKEALAGRLTILAGAGISMVAPTSLPSGHELMDQAISALCSTPELRSALRRLRRNKRYRSITPEIVFQRLYASLGQGSLAPFFQVLRHASSNDMHRLIAQIGRIRGVRLYTTNFDELLDDAMKWRGRILHLHGRLSHPATMIARINQVGRGLAPKLQQMTRRGLRKRVLCVVGYSGNDQDIRQAIDASGVDKVFWLVRNQKDPAWDNFAHFSTTLRILVAPADFDSFIRAWTGTAPTLQVPLPLRQLQARQAALARWSQMPRLADKFACISEVLFELEDYRGALAVSQHAYKFAAGTELASWFRVQSADALKILGRFSRAERAVRAAVRLANHLGDPYDIAGANNNLGVLLLEKTIPEPRRAVRPLRRALSVLDQIDKRTGTRRRREGLAMLRGRVLNNLGLCYETARDFDRALDFYRQAVAAKVRSGDVLGEAKTAGNIGIVMLRTHHPDAAKWRRRALTLMTRYNLQRDMAYVMLRTGEMMCANLQRRDGVRLLRKAYAACQSIDDPLFLTKLVVAAHRRWKVSV